MIVPIVPEWKRAYGARSWRSLRTELAELANAGVISLFGARADGQELEIIGEGF